MTEPYIGELRCFGFNFAPTGWAQCSGQLLPIQQNTALFSLLGTMYGGNGQTTFGLPDLRGRSALGFGQGPGLSNYTQGEMSGVESVTLTAQEVAPHTHPVSGATDATAKNPQNGLPGFTASESSYSATASVTMSPAMIGPNSGGQPHENRPPYLVLNWCIALNGIFPSRQ
jgi:microcystin-dependent protein